MDSGHAVQKAYDSSWFFKKYDFAYDEFFDCYLCPNRKVLHYTTTNREGYREYKSDWLICKSCPHRDRCTNSKDSVKVITRHVWENYMEQVEEIRHTIGMKERYKQRKETIERVFADAKEKHGMRYTQYRGLDKIKMELNLLLGYMNLKKLVIWKWVKTVRGHDIANRFVYSLDWLDFLSTLTLSE